MTAFGQLEPGAMLGGYQIERQLGRGGMGVVYLARQVALGRPVALKVIAPELAQNPDFQARFERESRMAAAIDHPNVVPVYEAGRIDGLAFIAMRFIDGIDGRSLIAREGRLAPGRAVTIVAQVAAALDAAHAHGLVHRDVKPGNVLITGSLDEPHCYLTDFGLTKHATSHGGLTATGQWMGTLDYVAPEQIEGRPADARVDVYALGCVLYEALTGVVPYPRDSDVAKLYAHVHEPPPAPRAAIPDLPGDLDDVVARGLAKNPDERFPSAGDLARAARAALAGRHVSQPERSVAAGAAAPSSAAAPAPPVAPHFPPPPSHAGTRLEAPYAPVAPAGPPHGWTPVTQQLPASGRGGTAVAIVVAALLLAAGGIAAAVIATGGKSGSSAKSQAPAGGQQAGVENTSAPPDTTGGPTSGSTTPPPTSAGGTALEPYTTAGYTASAPAWTLSQDYELQSDGRHVSKWIAPDGTSVLIDTTSNTSGDPRDSAVKLENGKAGSAGYRRLSFRPFTSGADPAFEWGYIDPDAGTRKVDLFFFRGGNGYAVLGEASTKAAYKQVRELALAMADSVSPL